MENGWNQSIRHEAVQCLLRECQPCCFTSVRSLCYISGHMRYFCPAIFIYTCPFLRDVQSGRLSNFSGNILTIGFMILCALQQPCEMMYYLFSCKDFCFQCISFVFTTRLRSAESAPFFLFFYMHPGVSCRFGMQCVRHL